MLKIKMWNLLFLLPIIVPTTSINVPVEKPEDTQVKIAVQKTEQRTPVYYIKDDAGVDSYLVPPDPQSQETLDVFATPATYLLPPTKDQRTDFYASAEPSAQSDWLPMLQTQPQRKGRLHRPIVEPIPIYLNKSPHKIEEGQFGNGPLPIPVPSTQLLPPSVDAANEFFTSLISEQDQNQQILVPNYHLGNLPIYNDDDGPTANPKLKPVEPTLSLHLLPPKLPITLKPPTKLYPKKYIGEFKPIPIPLTPLLDKSEPEIPKANPAESFMPQPIEELEEFTPSDEKTLFHYKKAENKRNLKGEMENVKQHYDDAVAETDGESTSSEQETSATNFRYPGQNVYSAPLGQAPTPLSSHVPNSGAAAAPAPDGRTEFRMHGMKGPHSYQFGFDTGKGKNRQFRYEERDNEGLVHGHYGYMDKLGKLRVVNYSAHPEYGFRAEEPVDKEPQAK